MVIGWLLYIFVVIGVGSLNWVVGILMLLLLGIITIVMPLASVATNGVREFKQHQIQHEFYTNLTDEVLGLGDWLISGRYNDFIDLQKKPIKEIAALRKQDHYFQWWRSFFVQFIILLTTLVLLIWSANQFTATKSLANWVAAFALAIFPAVSPFVNMSQGASEWPVYRRSIERVNALDSGTGKTVEQTSLTEPFKELAINDLTFKYSDGERNVVKHISMDIHPGEKVALLGPSGTGKSTFLKLIVGDLTPTDGQVLVNDKNILNLQDVRSSLFGILDQQPYLFDTTVMNNVRLGNVNATDQQVKDAIAAVGLKDLIESLPDKYDTQVQEAGKRFSGGERQRLSLARILLQDAPIIILDEPTVSLDPITEKKLLDKVFELLHDKTIIWVTHHLAGIAHVDQVRFMENGEFDMQGTPQELYKSQARFRQLYDLDRGRV